MTQQEFELEMARTQVEIARLRLEADEKRWAANAEARERMAAVGGRADGGARGPAVAPQEDPITEFRRSRGLIG